MFNTEFEFIFDKRVAGCRNVLVEKAKEYASDTDRLHNFMAAAGLNSCSSEEALWGMLTKHLVSLADMVKEPDNYSRAQWDEKIGDALNYLFLLDAIRNDGHIVENTNSGLMQAAVQEVLAYQKGVVDDG